ncbi:MAG: hypothetical protein C5B59_08520 [Bacteroidetes bacterium]|nr:MAG: hypothetical protein C5B59_08520 [Bacteroidota bacterium]
MAITATYSNSSSQPNAQGGSSVTAQSQIILTLTGDGSATSFTQSLASLGLISQGFGAPTSGTAVITKQQNSGLPGVWAKNKAYTLNTIIAAPNGTLQKVTTPGTSLNTSWLPTNAFTLNQIILDSFGNGHQVTGAGISGGAIPVNFGLNVASGTVTHDGGVTWQCLGQWPNFTSTLNATLTDGTVVWTGQGPNNVVVGYDAPTATVAISGGNLTLNFSEAMKAPGAQVTDTYGNVFTFGVWTCAITLTYGAGTATGNISTSWTSSTTVNTTLSLPTAGQSTVIVPMVNSGTITGGVLSFQASVDGTTYFPVYGTIPASFQPIAQWTLTAGSNVITFNVSGFNFFQAVLTSVVVGTGSVAIALQSQTAPPANLLTAGVVGSYNTTAPTPSNGSASPLQISPSGNLLTQSYRRSQVLMATGSIASATPATLLAAQSGFFTDLKSLVLTLSAESVAAYITVTISDGTNSYVFGYASQAIGTAGAGSWPIAINWDVPIPASNSNTAWTIVISAADATIRYVAQFIKQSANF